MDNARTSPTGPQRRPAPLTRNPRVAHGCTVFAGTRTPASILIDYLEGGESIETFLDDFPGVTSEQVDVTLELIRDALPQLAHEVEENEEAIRTAAQ